jgi:hypothetical protein
MVKISLSVAPILLVLCLAGFGDLLRVLLDWKRPRDAASDIFESAFFGILFVTTGVLITNFFFGLGNNPGPYVAGIGLALVAAFRWQSVFFWNQLLLLVIATSLISYFVGPVQLGYDAGLYHIPIMNWVAYQPVPLGLGNLEGRLGFDSAWLLFESAFRSEHYLRWSHLAVAEVAIRALVVAWIANGLLIELGKGWQTKAMAYVAAIVALTTIVALSVFIGPSQTSTDTSANLLAFCAWIAFCRLMLLHESERRTIADRELVLLLVLVTLAVTIKTTMLPIILLPAFLLVRMSRQKMHLLIIARRRAYALIALYFALWLGRNFMLTGCIIYPADVTCTTVPWGVGAANAKLMTALITAWARHPGPEALHYADLLNTAWIPEWFARQKFVVGAAAAAGVVFMSFLFVAFFVARRNRSSDRGDARQLVRVSIVCAAVGLGLWFLKMPEPRFLWVFFAILEAALVFQGFRMCDFAPPKIGVMPATAKKCIIWSAVFAIATTLAATLHRNLVPLTAPIPVSRIVTVSGGTQIYMPISGDQCWELFPCTPYDFGAKSIGTWNSRYFFRSTPDCFHPSPRSSSCFPIGAPSTENCSLDTKRISRPFCL